jgi:hypothetical protein
MKAKYYIFQENGEVTRTDDEELAKAYDEDGSSIAINADTGTFMSGNDIPEATDFEE